MLERTSTIVAQITSELLNMHMLASVNVCMYAGAIYIIALTGTNLQSCSLA